MRFQIGLLLAAVSSCAAQDRILWREPAEIKAVAPQPPFHFLSEPTGGSSPKILIRDNSGAHWRVKGGLEVRSETFAAWLVSSLGYFADRTVFVPRGKIEGAIPLKRAAGFIKPDGSFENASFELRDQSLKSLPNDWAWNYNPFMGTTQLNALKVLMMLLSNWDNKDVRDRYEGSNTAILQRQAGRRIEFLYYVSDWGQTLGAWGSQATPKNWNCATYTAQTKSFLQGREAQLIRFSFIGRHTGDFKNDIRIGDIRWLLGYLDRITKQQFEAALLAAGATPAESACFVQQISERIDQLKRIASN